MRRLLTRAQQPLSAVAEVFRNPNLRRLQLAYVGSLIGLWSYGVAVGVFAFQSGGTAAVGAVLALKMVPTAIAAPLTATLADRYPRVRVMVLTDLTRAVALAIATAAIVLHAPALVVYVITGVVTVVSTAFRPAQAALMPSLARSPEELTAANVASSAIESSAIFVGPALGGVLLAATSVAVVFGATILALLWSVVLVSRIRTEDSVKGEAPEAADEPAHESFARRSLAGFRTILGDRNLRVLVGMFGAQTTIDGALGVLTIVAALELLHAGEAGVGYLTSAVGVGGLLGGIAAVGLVGRRQLALIFGASLAMWGLPIAFIAALPTLAGTLWLLVMVGIANTVIDVAGITVLQRAVDDEVLGRVFGVLEGVIFATVGIGAAVTPALISAVGIRGALVVVGLFLPAVALLGLPALRRMDREAAVDEEALARLRDVPIFAPLPLPVIEGLAARLSRVRACEGEEVFAQGSAGDCFYVIVDGEVDVEVDRRHVRIERAGDHFGEIALLRDVPRTATVRARTDIELDALERDDFIAAVTGHAPSAEAAEAVVGTRLAAARPQLAVV